MSYFAQIRALARCFLVCALFVTPSLVLYRWANETYKVNIPLNPNDSFLPVKVGLLLTDDCWWFLFRCQSPFPDVRGRHRHPGADLSGHFLRRARGPGGGQAGVPGQPRLRAHRGADTRIRGLWITRISVRVPAGERYSGSRCYQRVSLIPLCECPRVRPQASALDAAYVLVFFFFVLRKRSEARTLKRERETPCLRVDISSLSSHAFNPTISSYLTPCFPPSRSHTPPRLRRRASARGRSAPPWAPTA